MYVQGLQWEKIFLPSIFMTPYDVGSGGNQGGCRQEMFTHPHGGSFRNDGYGVRGPYGKLSLFPYRNFRYMGCDSSSIFFFKAV